MQVLCSILYCDDDSQHARAHFIRHLCVASLILTPRSQAAITWLGGSRGHGANECACNRTVSILHLCVRNLSTCPIPLSCCTHATPTWRPPGPGRSLRSLTNVVLTSLKRGAPKAPSRLGRWAVRRFVCGRATRMASLASRGGTNLPPEGWLCTVGVYCKVCGRYGSRWRCLALPAWRCLARSCRRQSSPRARRLAASPPTRRVTRTLSIYLSIYLRPPIPRAIKICVHKKLLRSRSNFAHGICVSLLSA